MSGNMCLGMLNNLADIYIENIKDDSCDKHEPMSPLECMKHGVRRTIIPQIYSLLLRFNKGIKDELY